METARGSSPDPILNANFPRRWLVLLLLVLLGIAAAGYLYFRSEEKRIKEEHYRQLYGVGELKTAQIERWLRERFSDARVATGGFAMKNAVAEHLRNPQAPGPRSAIRRRLLALWEGDMYENIYLLSREGRLLLALKEKAGVDDLPMKRALEGRSVQKNRYCAISAGSRMDR